MSMSGQELTDYALQKCENIKATASQKLFVKEISNSDCIVDYSAGKKLGIYAQKVTFPSMNGEVFVRGKCTCGQPQLTDLFCKHAVAAERHYHESKAARGCGVTLECLLMEWIGDVHLVQTLLYAAQDLYVCPTFTDELQASEVLPPKAHLLRKLGPALRGPPVRKRMHWTRGYQGKRKRADANISPSPQDSSVAAQTGNPVRVAHDRHEGRRAYSPIDNLTAVPAPDDMSVLQSEAYMWGKNIAHLFNTGWAIGVIARLPRAKRRSGFYWQVTYKGDIDKNGHPQYWKHELNPLQYGVENIWVIVKK